MVPSNEFCFWDAGLLVQAKVKRAKVPKRHAVRRICPCHSMADNRNYICCGKPHYPVSFRTAIGIDLKSMLPRNSNDASGDIYRNIYFVLTTFSDSIPSLLLYEKTRWIASPPGKILLNQKLRTYAFRQRRTASKME